jgi:D-amino-acid dehydrogenase
VKVAVIGAGIAGISSAWELAADGHEVTVFDRRGSSAAENTFAHAGLLAPALAEPWTRHPGHDVRNESSMAVLGWRWRAWLARRPARLNVNRARLQKLAWYSHGLHGELTTRLRLEHEQSQGQLLLFRTVDDFTVAQPRLARWKEAGVRFNVLKPAQCHALEPGLDPNAALHCGVQLPQHIVGNGRQFALMLRSHAQQRGVTFRQHTTVQAIQPGKKPAITSLITSAEGATRLTAFADATAADDPDTEVLPHEPVTEHFDAVVVCAAEASVGLLKPLGLTLPLLTVYGYSVTAPLRRSDHHPFVGPRAAVTDEHADVVVSPLGDRVRISGAWEFGGAPRKNRKKSLQNLYKAFDLWFPGAARMSHAQIWKGARPTLPEGLPALGASGLPGVWLNIGHGDHGWTLAAGSARVVADLVKGAAPAIDITGLTLDRAQG